MRVLNLAAVLFFVTAAGCVSAEDESVDTTRQSLISSNRMAANRMAANRMAANRMAANRMAANRMAANRMAANRMAANRMAANRMAANRMAANRMAANRMAANGLIDSEDGREVLKYAIECAIPEGIILVATDSSGTEYEFPGSIGLAPRWLERGLTENDQRWVSACLFARVNAHDVSVLISMRGQSKALETSDDERAGWSAEEGAFYGQYFVPESEPIRWYACSGRDLDVAHNDMRDCANPDPNNPGYTVCGFTYTGDCRTTCESYSKKGEYYRNCASGEDDDGGDYHQVITTFVQP